MHSRPPTRRSVAGLLLAGLALPSRAWDEPAPDPAASATEAPPVRRLAQPAPSGKHSRYRPDRFAGRAKTYYEMVWGVDSLSVKWAESGEIIRFAWRVLDADKARMLNLESAQPALIAPRAGVSLVVPQMENIGRLRQSVAPEPGKSYWMAFSNKGRLVRRGDRVAVQIGEFRADGLVVD
jgi:hypothetical protein